MAARGRHPWSVRGATEVAKEPASRRGGLSMSCPAFENQHKRAAAIALVCMASMVLSTIGQTEHGTLPVMSSRGVSTATPDEAWTRAMARDQGLTGFDGCASLPLTGGRVLWLFSDSIVGRVEGGRHASGATIVNNAVAITRGLEPTPEFYWGQSENPRAMFPSARAGEWYWLPGGAVEVRENGPLVIFGARMGRTGKPDAGVWDFEGRGSDAIIVENPQDGPLAWRWHAVGLFGSDGGKPGCTRAWGAAVLRPGAGEGEFESDGEGGTTIVFGIDATDVWHKKLLIARCPTNLIWCRDAWLFRAADGAWSAKAEDAAPVCDDMADEFTISRVGDGYVMVHMEANLGKRVMVRRSAAIDGPWSDPRAVCTAPEPGRDSRIMVYGAKAHPEVSGEGGLLVSYCVNSSDFWHMLGDATIYRARFVRVRVEEMEGRRDK